ncbi:hypothetical protein BCR35DRAFT_353577, partial [Leucosporidium creatinivorum]
AQVRTSALFFLLFTRVDSCSLSSSPTLALRILVAFISARRFYSIVPFTHRVSYTSSSNLEVHSSAQRAAASIHAPLSPFASTSAVEPWLSSLLRRRSQARRLVGTSLKGSRCSPSALPLPLRLKPSLRSESLLLPAGVASDARRCGSVK